MNIERLIDELGKLIADFIKDLLGVATALLGFGLILVIGSAIIVLLFSVLVLFRGGGVSRFSQKPMESSRLLASEAAPGNNDVNRPTQVGFG